MDRWCLMVGDGPYAVVVPDAMAGCRRRYTVYRIPDSPSRRVRVIGRELPPRLAWKIAEKATGRTKR